MDKKDYIARVNTREEAEAKALDFLGLFTPASGTLTTTSNETTSEDGSLVYWTVEIANRADSPIVYIQEEKIRSEDMYFLYFLPDRSMLSFCDRHLADYSIMLPRFQPLLKPTEVLNVEDVRTARGRKHLEAYFNYYKKENTKHERALARFKEADKDMKIYALFEDYGQMTLEEIKEDIESGDYEGGTIDGELVLAELTGETYETEEKYLEALASFCGKEAVEKHQEELKAGYRWHTVDYYLLYLEYRLRQTEDYASLVEEEPALAGRFGFKKEYLDELVDIKDASVVDVALAHYLANYICASSMYDGLTETRIADYLRAPEDAIRKVFTYENLKSTLL